MRLYSKERTCSRCLASLSPSSPSTPPRSLFKSIFSWRDVLGIALILAPFDRNRTKTLCTVARRGGSTASHVDQGRGGHRGRRRGDGYYRPEGAVLGPADSRAAGHERAGRVVTVPRPHRRVHGLAHPRLRQHRHRHRVQVPVLRRRREVHRRRVPRRRLVLRRHRLRPRLLHQRRLRRPHQPGGVVRAVLGRQGVAGARRAIHGGAVPRRHLRRGHRERDHEAPFRLPRRRRQRGGRGLLARRGPRRRDLRHLRPRLHRLLRHRPQAHRARRLRPAGGGAADRIGGVRGAPGDHTDHRHGHQPGEKPGRRRPVQPSQNLGAALDLLGRALHRRRLGCVLPQDRAARHRRSQGGAAGAGLVQQNQLERLTIEKRKDPSMHVRRL